MKIAFIGAQGVGKTTLCAAITKEFKNSHIVKESVRECPYPCDQRADFKTEWWVLSHSILAEQEARESKCPLIVTDRSLLDIAVFTKLINETGDGRITNIQRAMIEDSIVKWHEEDPYDHVFFVKVNPEIWKTRDLDDGFRSLDIGWYTLLTKEFELAIERLNIAKMTKIHTIENNGDFDTCLKNVISAL
ncbi:MAG: AAA family ATPase [Bdellovibrionota bacterium]